MTLPVPVILKRFLAPDLVFNLGIWLSYRLVALLEIAGSRRPVRIGMSEKNRHGSPNGRAALIEARFICERGGGCKGEEESGQGHARNDDSTLLQDRLAAQVGLFNYTFDLVCF